MQRPTLFEGIIVALVGSLLLGPLVLLMQTLVGSLLAWKATVVVMTALYIAYLLAQSGRKQGRVTLGLGALAILCGGFVLNVHLSTLLLIALTLIWGIRSFAYSQNLLSAALQGGLCLLGCGAARLLYEHNGSLVLAIWGFFLLQAAFVLIPASLQRQGRSGDTPDRDAPQDRFARAYHTAEQALHRLHMER